MSGLVHPIFASVLAAHGMPQEATPHPEFVDTAGCSKVENSMRSLAELQAELSECEAVQRPYSGGYMAMERYHHARLRASVLRQQIARRIV